MGDQTILWRTLQWPGHESLRVYFQEPEWRLAGTAVFAEDGRPCRLDYHIRCDAEWRTRSATVQGWAGDETIAIDLEVEAGGRWRANGQEVPAVAGCTDLDLNFSPATNTLPIRRLNLAAGRSAPVRAAWLRFPSLRLEPLEQVYERRDETTYRYRSTTTNFTADLQVNSFGLVTHYPGIWEIEQPFSR